MISKLFETIIIGLVAGIIGGSLGISSAPILVPFLVLFNITKNYRTAIGTTILVIIPPLSILAIREYYKKGEVAIHSAIILMAAVIIGNYLGSLITTDTDISDVNIALMTSFVLGCLSIFWLVMALTGFKINIKALHSFLPTILF
jgi:hypothetical protein